MKYLGIVIKFNPEAVASEKLLPLLQVTTKKKHYGALEGLVTKDTQPKQKYFGFMPGEVEFRGWASNKLGMKSQNKYSKNYNPYH